MEIPWFIATLLGAMVFGTGGFLIRFGSMHHKDAGAWVLWGLYLSGSLAFTLFAIADGSFLIRFDAILAGMILGLGLVFGNVMWVRAFEYGPASLTGPVVNSYNVLIIIMSVLFFGEVLTIKEIFAIGVILFAISLLSYDPNETLRIRDRRWFIFVVLSILFFFARNGGLKITEEAGYNNTALLVYGYLVGVFWFAYVLRRKLNWQNFIDVRASLGWGLLAGLCSFGGLQLFSYAIERGPASIIAPVFSLNGLVFAMLTIILLRERLSRYQTLSLIGSVIGLIVLRI